MLHRISDGARALGLHRPGNRPPYPVRYGSSPVVEPHAEVRGNQNEGAQIRIFSSEHGCQRSSHRQADDAHIRISLAEIFELCTREPEPLAPTGYDERLDRPSVTRQERSSNAEARGVKVIREEPQSLGCIAKAVQEKHTARP